MKNITASDKVRYYDAIIYLLNSQQSIGWFNGNIRLSLANSRGKSVSYNFKEATRLKRRLKKMLWTQLSILEKDIGNISAYMETTQSLYGTWGNYPWYPRCGYNDNNAYLAIDNYIKLKKKEK